MATAFGIQTAERQGFNRVEVTKAAKAETDYCGMFWKYANEEDNQKVETALSSHAVAKRSERVV